MLLILAMMLTRLFRFADDAVILLLNLNLPAGFPQDKNLLYASIALRPIL